MRRLFPLLFTSIAFCSCCEEEPIEPTPEVWEKFIGTYNVTKLENGDTYQMTIEHVGRDTLVNQAIIDSLLITNYGDRFNIHKVFASNGGFVDERTLSFYTDWENIDKTGNRWAFWVLSQDTTTEELENRLVDDELLLYFNLNNVAFYIEDEVPFYECQCKHLAVKVD